MALGTGDTKDVNVKDVKGYFGMSLTEMKEEWTPLSDADKNDIKKGLSIPEGQKGHLTY